MEFNANYSLLKVLLRWYSYEGLRPLIKLWIDEKGQEQLVWDDLIKKLIRAEAKTKIKVANSQNLDQCYPQSKHWLKLISKK